MSNIKIKEFNVEAFVSFIEKSMLSGSSNDEYHHGYVLKDDKIYIRATNHNRSFVKYSQMKLSDLGDFNLDGKEIRIPFLSLNKIKSVLNIFAIKKVKKVALTIEYKEIQDIIYGTVLKFDGGKKLKLNVNAKDQIHVKYTDDKKWAIYIDSKGMLCEFDLEKEELDNIKKLLAFTPLIGTDTSKSIAITVNKDNKIIEITDKAKGMHWTDTLDTNVVFDDNAKPITYFLKDAIFDHMKSPLYKVTIKKFDDTSGIIVFEENESNIFMSPLSLV